MTNHIVKSVLAAIFATSAMALPEVATMDEAISTARAQQRHIFVDFTGTDWCTACIYLRDKIVNSAEFEAAMGDKFVLVPVDFPRSPELVARISDEEKREREALLVSFKIEGLPGVVLMDCNGLPFEVIQGTRRTPGDYIPLMQAGLDKLAARDAAFAEAAGKSGLDKAKALDKGLKALPDVCRDKYHAVIAEINSLDAENTLGYKGYGDVTRRRITQQEELRLIMDSFRGKLDPENLSKNITMLGDFLGRTDLVPEVRQSALRSMGDSYAFLRDYAKMQECYKAAYEVAPESRMGRTLKKNIDYFEKNVKPMLGK